MVLSVFSIQHSVAFDYQGVTAEEFISSVGQTKSRYGRLRELIASRLKIPLNNVDIFTVLNHPTSSNTIDIRYSAHGSPYYRPSRLDGVLGLNQSLVKHSTLCSLLTHSACAQFAAIVQGLVVEACQSRACCMSSWADNRYSDNQPLLR